MKLLTIYDKLEKLVLRLPEAVHQPILREIKPIKTLFLMQRPPRIALVGERAAKKGDLISAVFGDEVPESTAEILHDGAWQSLSLRGRGTLRLLDARRPVSPSVAETALAAEAPDLYLFVRSSAGTKGFETDVKHAVELMEFGDSRHPTRPRLLAVQLHGDTEMSTRLHCTLQKDSLLGPRLTSTVALTGNPLEAGKLVELIAAEMPHETHLETARLSGNRVLQRELARTVLKSVTAICGAIGTQPIPLADFPILTSLQASMVAAIMHISGREMSVRLAGEFIGAIGANIGAALVLREGARAVLKFVPVWGDIVAGAIAAGGTYAIGRAAIAYFIEGASLKDARNVFRKKPPRALLKP